MSASPLLIAHLHAVRHAAETGPVLDLACGTGRNGLFLLENTLPVVFSDLSPAAIQQVADSLESPAYRDYKHQAKLWQVDFELDGSSPLTPNTYGAIVVFRYLHRPLLPLIKEAIRPGGLLIYETFTREQAKLGRPTNPDFLLRPNELVDCFDDWTIVHSFEGVVDTETGDGNRAIAQLVAEKPSSLE